MMCERPTDKSQRWQNSNSKGWLEQLISKKWGKQKGAVLVHQHTDIQSWHGRKAAPEYPLWHLALQQALWRHNFSASQPFRGRHQDPIASGTCINPRCITAYVRTVDSGVIDLAIWFFESLSLSELWVGFGTGRNYHDIPIHTLYSQLLGCCKKTALAAWSSIPDLTDTLVALTLDPHLFIVGSVHMQSLEHFVIFMYSKGCSATGVIIRHKLFTTGCKFHSTLPSHTVPACKASAITG